MMELTFLVSRDGENAKRVQARRACNSCRHKKKRCYHDTSQDHSTTKTPSADLSSFTGSQSPASQASRRDPVVRSRSASPRSERLSSSSRVISVGHGAQTLDTTDAGTTAEVEQGSRHFACHTNPMVTLMDQNGSRLQRGRSHKGVMGLWMRPEENTIEQSEPQGTSSQTAPGTSVQLDRLPPKVCQEALMDIYFRRIQPVLPVLDEEKVRAQYKEGDLSLRLLQAICLVAAKDQSAVPFLCLGSRSMLLTLEKFSNIIYADVMQHLSRRTEKKIPAIQILVLLSLHEWGPTGSEDRSLNLALAIHHAHTIGLHLMRPDQHFGTSARALFWCLWSLDRWNAAMNGRPIMIQDHDINQTVDDVISTFQSPFCVWLRIADKLGKVIHFYRPIMKGADHSELDLPCFEEIVEQCQAWNMAPDLVESLELVYHSVIILSTYSSGLQGRERPRMSRIRQSHSILTIASLSSNIHTRKFLPLPMIGYTISLAFSVTYKQLRESKLLSARHTAVSQIRLFHQCLEKMSSTWWPAAVMTRLGQRVVNNIPPTINQERSTDPEIDITRPNSLPGPSNIEPYSLIWTDDSQSHSGVGGAQVARRIDAGYQSAHPLADHQLGSDLYSDYDSVDSMPLSTIPGLEDVDTFFSNILDVNIPSYSNDQILVDLDLPDFDLGQSGLA